MDRRSFIKTGAAALAASPGYLYPSLSMAADEIVVGGIHDLSGGLDGFGKTMFDCLTLAVEEQNAAGGLLNRKLRLQNYDAQSGVQTATQYAQRLSLNDKASVVLGPLTSAAREVIRPVLDRYKTLYFYNAGYEGGVCDGNVFCTGVTPAQCVAQLVPFAMKRWGKKIYFIGADYNYGQITSQWVKKYAQENGGQVVAMEFFPLDVSNFGPTITKIQAAKPDMVVSTLVGGAHMSFYRQWAAAGMLKKIPHASTTFGNANEHVIMSADETDGVLVACNFILDSKLPEAVAFKERFYKRFGDNYPNISDTGMCTYQGFKLWAEGVKKAGSLDRARVIKALESGISISAPSGKVALDPATHHCVLNISVGEAKNKKLVTLQTFEQQPPSDTKAVCDLIKNPKDNKQYVIKA
jgi:branched-chain amino acid transport system substrate-binding protein